MNGLISFLCCHLVSTIISTQVHENYFPLVDNESVAEIYIDQADYNVVETAADMLSDDIERITGKKVSLHKVRNHREINTGCAIIAGTLGQSHLIEWIVKQNRIDIKEIEGKWESFMIMTTEHPEEKTPLLVVIGSDRRGTAYGLTTLCEEIGVSPWYWWADVQPQKKDSLFIKNGCHVQKEPSVQYRGIFINDERFGGWAKWVEQTFDKETGKVGPKVYEKVFELLLRLKANYLWPAMHNGSAAFNSNPENARLADDYAIVMGTSHCEQMLRNNEDEWKNAGIYGDFNYITNRQTMIGYWEERVRTNGKYENTYTLGLRGIHDYPMEGAQTTQERVLLMQQAIDDQRDILRRNIDRPVEEVPQVLCTYEEVLEAYHNGLQVPEDVTLLWSDDKHGYCRNLSNPQERERKGGAGIYYHLSYHGDPASWIWLSPLSPAFISTELTKAYEFGASKIWVFNVGDIKPAEKEISFAMDLAWDIEKWGPENAHNYTTYWASKTFGEEFAEEIARMQAEYYRLQAAGKDAHVWFVNYTKNELEERIEAWRTLAEKASELAVRMPLHLQNAYFELVSYPISGAAMLNEYQLLARRSMVRAAQKDIAGAKEDSECVKQKIEDLNEWTRRYHEDILGGKWNNFFNWKPYFMYYGYEIPYCTEETVRQAASSPQAHFIPTAEALSHEGFRIYCENDCEVPLWMEALTPVRNFSKAPEDNVFCHVYAGTDDFDASATPVNNVWHSPYVGPMWSKVGTLHLKKGENVLKVSEVKPDASIERMFLGIWPPFTEEPRQRIAAQDFDKASCQDNCHITVAQGLGFSDGVLVLPFDTPTYDVEDAPYVEYDVTLGDEDRTIEVRTLPTLHVYENREARYAIQIGDTAPRIFSIHTSDFSSEWRYNVLHGYSSRSVSIPSGCSGTQKIRIWLLDPGIVLQEILIR